MTTPPVTCPYCNSLVAMNPDTASSHLTCPRCGEAFELLTPEPLASIASGRHSASAASVEIEPVLHTGSGPYQKPVGANRRLAFLILGVMGCLAVTALAYALYTQPFRRQNDKGIVKSNPKRRPPLDSVDSINEPPTPPAKLAALGWLPPDTTVVVGVQVRELVASKAGKALLTQPVDVGGVALRVDAVANWTGFKIDEIENLVLAIPGERKLPMPVLIVRARADDRETTVRDRLRAERSGTAGGRPVYEFKPANAPAFLSPLYVCWVDSRTAVYALLPHHLNDIPAAPVADLRQLPAEVRTVLNDRVRSGGPLWIAGHSDDWNKTTLFKPLFSSLTEKDRARLSKVSTFAAWMQQADDPVVIEAAFDCGTDTAAVALQKYLDIPDVGADPDWKASHAGGWLTVQFRLSLQKIRERLER